MSLHTPTVITILLMALGCYGCRAGGYWLLTRVRPSAAVQTVFSYIPGCLFVSFVIPAVISGGPKEWIGAAVALLTVILTGSVIWPIFTGTGAAWMVWLLIGTAQAAEVPRWQSLLAQNSFAAQWQSVGDVPWSWEQGALLGNAGDGFVVSNARYSNFELRVEVLIEPQTNSGVFIRCSDAKDVSPTNCYEVNLWDDRDGAFATGSIVQRVEPATKLRASGQWSTLTVRAQGTHLQVKLNDTTAVELDDTAHSEGHIALQFRGSGSVRFRKVEIRPL